jgi:hypothetical protein
MATTPSSSAVSSQSATSSSASAVSFVSSTAAVYREIIQWLKTEGTEVSEEQERGKPLKGDPKIKRIKKSHENIACWNWALFGCDETQKDPRQALWSFLLEPVECKLPSSLCTPQIQQAAQALRKEIEGAKLGLDSNYEKRRLECSPQYAE